MAYLSQGLATFNSCNKAGAIPLFNKHLQRHPEDYTALKYRGTAHRIVGNKELAIEDFKTASKVSTGAMYLLALLAVNDLEENVSNCKEIMQEMLHKHPDCGEVWFTLGEYAFQSRNYEEARIQLEKAVTLTEEQCLTGEPYYCWCKYILGEVYMHTGDVDLALDAYKAAIKASNTLTVAHLGSATANLIKGNKGDAKTSFEIAKSLNSELVHWKTFDAFHEDISNGGTQMPERYWEKQMNSNTAGNNQGNNTKTPRSDGTGGTNGGKGKGKGNGKDKNGG